MCGDGDVWRWRCVEMEMCGDGDEVEIEVCGAGDRDGEDHGGHMVDIRLLPIVLAVFTYSMTCIDVIRHLDGPLIV